MLKDKGLKVDLDKFEELMTNQKTMAKAAWKGSGDSSNDGDFKALLEKYGLNEFVGYTNITYNSKILALLDENFKEVETLENQIGWVLLDKTPFYATSGGQNGDIGAIEFEGKNAVVLETSKFHNLNLSKVDVKDTKLNKNQKIEAVVINRHEVAKNHSATHLLQAALKMVLGDSVSQAGSFNDANKLRFDFTYPKALTSEQINEVEDLVNSMINRALAGVVEELPLELAKKKGAIAMFGEKYGEVVRVVSFGEDVSVEFCGGTHVKNTADIGSFYIIKESGVSAGIRRIEAVVGASAFKYTKEQINKLDELQSEIKSNDLIAGVKKLKNEIKELKNELKNSQNQTQAPINEEIIGDTKVVVCVIENGDLKKIVDDMKNANEKLAILLLQEKDDKVLIVAGSKNTNIKAGDWIKNISPIVGGGGGRPDFATAGGKDITKIEEAKIAALTYAKENL